MANLDLWRAAAVALDEYACNGDKGRDKRDPVYVEVTEHRDVPPYDHYSSCADRAHWKLWRLGVRSPFVNRESRTPQPGDWHVGVNISELWNASRGSPADHPDATWMPEPGDELLIWNYGNDAHSLSILSYDHDARMARTANYGTAGMSKATFPGAKCSTAPLVYTAQDGWLYGLSHKRKVQRITKLAKVVPLITAKPNLSGPEWSAAWTGEVCDALEAYVP